MQYRLFVPDNSPESSKGAIRVVFPAHKVVLKIWTDNDDFYSVKQWEGDLDRIVSSWRMDEAHRSLTVRERTLVRRALRRATAQLNELATPLS